MENLKQKSRLFLESHRRTEINYKLNVSRKSYQIIKLKKNFEPSNELNPDIIVTMKIIKNDIQKFLLYKNVTNLNSSLFNLKEILTKTTTDAFPEEPTNVLEFYYVDFLYELFLICNNDEFATYENNELLIIEIFIQCSKITSTYNNNLLNYNLTEKTKFILQNHEYNKSKLIIKLYSNLIPDVNSLVEKMKTNGLFDQFMDYFETSFDSEKVVQDYDYFFSNCYKYCDDDLDLVN